MSDIIKHECGIAVLRLLKPLEYYQEKYGTWRYGLNKLYLLMEKQHNRGQDGAGVLGLKLDSVPGKKYIDRKRSVAQNPIIDCYNQIFDTVKAETKNDNKNLNNPTWAKENLSFASEIYMGHLRYGTFGKNNVELVHPVLRLSNWKSKTLALAGNFNLTNVDELFQYLVDFGQHPKEYSDTVTALELIGLFIDEENQKLFREYKNQGYSNSEISGLIEKNIDIAKILRESTKNWDGGYVMGGIVGNGDTFVMRDPNGIRPAFYYYDDEIFILTSERPVIQTAMNVYFEKIKELEPGSAIIIKKNGEIQNQMIRLPEAKTPCSFERIYFSRGSDKEIYKERKMLGELVVPDILKCINYDLENTVFSFIPNTAEIAFYGMIEGLTKYINEHKKKQIIEKNYQLTEKDIDRLLALRPRIEKTAIKDTKMRTFITQDEDRNAMVEHIYDVTYGIINDYVDSIIIIDDSIVRGTTLKQSILKILDRVAPKKIIIVSSAPQIRYPDCYGIDMTKIGDFVAFEAAIELLHENKMKHVIDDVYKKCKAQQYMPKEDIVNYVKNIYQPFSYEQISKKITQIIKTSEIKADFEIIFQTIENLHVACPNNNGDWYFTGNYPTAGGNKVVNTSFINFYENKNERAY